MIVGIGLNLVEIEQLRREIENEGDSVMESILLPNELDYCRAKRSPLPFYAARLAAKRAFLDAAGDESQDSAPWHDIEVLRDERGKPSLALSGKATLLAGDRGVERIHLSLTHARDHAAAAVILEGRG